MLEWARFYSLILSNYVKWLVTLESTETGCLFMYSVNWWVVAPVSYTHLDVYKRQLLSTSTAERRRSGVVIADVVEAPSPGHCECIHCRTVAVWQVWYCEHRNERSANCANCTDSLNFLNVGTRRSGHNESAIAKESNYNSNINCNSNSNSNVT